MAGDSKPLCWFWHVWHFDSWLHGPEELERCLDHPSVLHGNICFTVEMEKDGHLSVLSIDIYTRLDGSLYHTVCQKPTHTNLYVSPRSYHHPSSKQSVFAALCDSESVHDEFNFLKITFRESGYSQKYVECAVSPPVRTCKPTSNTPQSPSFHMFRWHTAALSECWPFTSSVGLLPRKISSFVHPL